MDIEKLIVGSLKTNSYLAIDIYTRRCIIIDPGDNANAISENILTQDLIPISIVATHGHFDHILAADELQKAFEIPFLIHQKDKELLQKMQNSATYWLKRNVIEKPPANINYITQKEVIEFGELILNVLHTPGHTPGGICLFNTQEEIVFTGDTLFKNSRGRTDFAYGSPSQINQSINHIEETCKGFTAYPGHGKTFNI
jgi:glyoxylase-like metal-dependent hydrolase (beta-lactamase superfamily II)